MAYLTFLKKGTRKFANYNQCQLAADIVLDTLQLLAVIAPCHDITVRTDGGQPLAVRLVQVFLDPFAVNLVGTAVTGKRVHVPRRLLELAQVLRRIVDEEVLVHDMVTREQDTYRRGKGEPAVAAVGGEPFVTAVRGDIRGQVFRIGKSVQAEVVVTYPHLPGAKCQVLQAGGVLLREREILLDDSRRGVCPGNLPVRQACHAEQAAVVDDALELFAALHETGEGLLVRHLLRDDEIPREGVVTARRAAAFPARLGKEQVAGVLQIRPLVEMPLETAAEETQVILADIGTVAFLDEEVLLVNDAVVRQHLDRLGPCRMDGLVFRLREREEFGQFHPVGHGDVRVLADDAPVLHGQQRKLAFQRSCFHYVSHTFLFLEVGEINRRNFLRLMM